MRKTYSSSNNDVHGGHGIGALGVLQIVFIVLKAINVIDWSWWQVFIPTFVSLGLTVIAILILAILWIKDIL